MRSLTNIYSIIAREKCSVRMLPSGHHICILLGCLPSRSRATRNSVANHRQRHTGPSLSDFDLQPLPVPTDSGLLGFIPRERLHLPREGISSRPSRSAKSNLVLRCSLLDPLRLSPATRILRREKPFGLSSLGSDRLRSGGSGRYGLPVSDAFLDIHRHLR